MVWDKITGEPLYDAIGKFGCYLEIVAKSANVNDIAEKRRKSCTSTFTLNGICLTVNHNGVHSPD